ncbi:MAG: hypothetical protein ABI643_03230 [Candidatus Doudnabacteria bacterium]
MILRNRLIFICVFAGLFLALHPVFAARTVPVGTPLQPVPQNTAPNYSQSVNSTGNAVNLNQQMDQNQISSPPNAEVNTPNPAILAPGDIAAPGEPVLLYWTLLIFGVLGLGAAIGWLYWRYRKQ